MNRRTLLSLGTAAIVGSGGLWLAAQQRRPSLPPLGAALAETTDPANLPEITDYGLGDPDAPVTILEYASFTCPHCREFHDNVYPKLKAQYIDTGKVRFIYREVYFDRPGLWAAMVARCGGEMRYFGIVDMLFDKQKEWIGDGKGETIVANLRRLGRSAGLSDDQLDACLKDGDKAQALVNHYEANTKEYDIKGTPSLVINGELHTNMSFEDLKKLIDEALAG